MKQITELKAMFLTLRNVVTDTHTNWCQPLTLSRALFESDELYFTVKYNTLPFESDH